LVICCCWRPNSATISADKMNVVYRGVVNPMSIFAGIWYDVSARSGLTGEMVSTHESTKGNEVVISVSGKMSDGNS
jgi:hypothetical protein